MGKTGCLLLAAVLTALGGCRRSTSVGVGLPFPVPDGYTVSPAPVPVGLEATPGDYAVRLRDSAGVCQLRFSRSFSQMSLDEWTAALADSFAKGGHAPEPQPAMSLDGAETKHLLVRFPDGLTEGVYTLRSGDQLLTLITVHPAACKDDFQAELDSFRV